MDFTRAISSYNFGCKCCKNTHTKIYKHDAVENSKNLAHKTGYSVHHADITATKKKDEEMRDEERESDEEVNSFVIMVKYDLVDQEGEGGGLLAYPENV